VTSRKRFIALTPGL